MINKSKKDFNEKGITMISLAVTIAVLLIILSVIITTVNETDIIGQTEENANTYYNEKQAEENEVQEMATRLDNSIVKFTPQQVERINNKLKTGALYTVSYEPKTIASTVTVGSNYNGNLTTQTFNQNDTGAKGSNKLNWYVLYADANQVNLVSSVSNTQISFKGAGGYDNCIYFLDEIAETLFSDEDLGVEAENVHILKLSDIKNAVEQINGWDSNQWTSNVINNATTKSVGVTTIGSSKKYTNASYTYYPKIYGTSTGKVHTDNPMYDEKINGSEMPISNDSSTVANELTVNGTYWSYANQRTTMITNLGTFGNTAIAGELFNASGTDYWLGTRCIDATGDRAVYNLRTVTSGALNGESIYTSTNLASYPSYAFRIVVSVPASYIDVANDGTVTLKE